MGAVVLAGPSPVKRSPTHRWMMLVPALAGQPALQRMGSPEVYRPAGAATAWTLLQPGEPPAGPGQAVQGVPSSAPSHASVVWASYRERLLYCPH